MKIKGTISKRQSNQQLAAEHRNNPVLFTLYSYLAAAEQNEIPHAEVEIARTIAGYYKDMATFRKEDEQGRELPPI